MDLYKVKISTVIPGSNPQDAANRYYDYTESSYNGAVSLNPETDLEIAVPHEVFVKLFRFARSLNDVDQYSIEEIRTLTATYADLLGYGLTEEEVEDGILIWVERFEDTEDDELEDWMN